MRGVLQNVAHTLDEEDVAHTPDKRQSLRTAYDACKAALQEVEVFLNKHSGVGERTGLRWISIMKFITSDIEGLRTQLDLSGKLLERSLAGLGALSRHTLHAAIRELRDEYRQGRHERSVLSLAIVDHKAIDEQEAIAQVEQDLMDKDVHPDAIDLHRTEIRQWIIDIIPESVPDEDRVNHTRRANTMGHLSYRPATFALSPTSLTQPSSSEKWHGIAKRHEQLSTRTDLYTGPMYQSPLRYTDERTTLYDEPSIPLPSPSDTPSSRRESLSSHRSQGSDWHPRREEHTEYVLRMLTKPFAHGPTTGVTDDEHASFYFARAFHQMDCTDRGFLTRNQVIKICERALVDANGPLDRHSLNQIVHFGDRNRDGKVDKSEFRSIMLEILRISLQICFQNDIIQADTKAVARYLATDCITLALPWGFSRTSGPLCFDEIEQVCVTGPPALLPLKSFTLMAQEVASRGVRVINEADEHWQRALPDRESRADFRKTFDAALNVACSFSLFYNTEGETQLSDLDDMACDLTILRAAQPTDKTLSSRLIDLLRLRSQCEDIASQLRGLIWRIEHLNPDQAQHGDNACWPSPETLTRDLDMWRKSHVGVWAYRIHDQWAKTWQHVTQAVSEHREWYEKERASTQSYRIGVDEWKDSVKSQYCLHAQAVKIVRDYTQNLREMTDAGPPRLPVTPLFVLNDLRIELPGRNSKIPFDSHIVVLTLPGDHLYEAKIMDHEDGKLLSGPHIIRHTRMEPIIL